MIKASALLAAVAIGLLVAGVLASSLLMVYVSIGVCAVAALILAVGILTHWSEIFGRGEARPASVPGAWSAPQAGVSNRPVLASAVPSAVAGRQERHAGHEDAGGPPAGEQAAAVRPGNEFPVAGRSDDLWERVEEELGSAGKRDTGALSWPATELPVFREDPGSPGAGHAAREARPAGRVTRRYQRLDMGTGCGLAAARDVRPCLATARGGVRGIVRPSGAGRGCGRRCPG